MPTLHLELVVAAPPGTVYAVAKEQERYPEFLPDVERVEVVEREGERVVTSWVGRVKELARVVKWREEDIWDDQGLACTFRALSGDWDRYQGTWLFRPHPQGTLMSLSLEYEMAVPLIGPLIKGLIARLVEANCSRMLEGLRARVEGLQHEEGEG